MRESPALDVILLLQKLGAVIAYSDPYVPALELGGVELASSPEEAAAEADCVVIITDHAAFDYQGLVARSRLIVDTRNALKGIESKNIVRL
jgi:UDP-N-acetyl-D-glucosamine dehydrogenase